MRGHVETWLVTFLLDTFYRPEVVVSEQANEKEI